MASGEYGSKFVAKEKYKIKQKLNETMSCIVFQFVLFKSPQDIKGGNKLNAYFIHILGGTVPLSWWHQLRYQSCWSLTGWPCFLNWGAVGREALHPTARGLTEQLT